jgi:TonB family protein
MRKNVRMVGLFLFLFLFFIWSNVAIYAQAKEISPPVLKKFVEARYPQAAQQKGLEAEVILLIIVDENGKVVDTKIAQSAGPDFDKAALEAVGQFEFAPAHLGEQPVAVQITYSYEFIITAESRTPDHIMPETAKDNNGSDYQPEQASSDLSAATNTSLPARESVINLNGIILERGTKKILSNVEIVIMELELSVFTDQYGRFSFRGVPPGTYTIRCILLDYKPKTEKIEIVAGIRTELKIFLENSYSSPYEVTVYGKRAETVVTHHVVDAEEIQKVAGTQGDTLKVVEVLPGVARTPGGIGGMLIFRGGNDNSSNVFVDGMTIPQLFHFGGLRSVINSNIIKNLEFYPGNFGAFYDNSLAGIIDVETRQPYDDRLHAKADLNIFEGGFLIEGPITEDLSFFAAFHRNWHDIVLRAVWPEDNPVSLTTAPNYFDYQYKLNWKLGNRQNLELFSYGSRDKLALIVGSDEDTGLDIDMMMMFHNFQLKHEWRVLENVRNDLSLQFSYIDQDESYSQEYFVFLQTYFIQARDDFSIRHSDHYQTRLGLKLYGGPADINVNMPHLASSSGEEEEISMAETRNSHFRAYPLTLGAYGEFQAEPLPGLQLIPGVRADYYSYTKALSTDARFTVRYQLWQPTVLKAGLGTYHKVPDAAYIVEGYGNPNLDDEWSVQYSLGIDQRISDFISTELTGFYVDMRDLIVSNPDMATDITAPPYINDGKGRSYGLEFILKHDKSKYFSGWISYTVSRSERKLPQQDWMAYDFDQTHNLAVVGMLKLPGHFELGIRFRLVSGNIFDISTTQGGYDTDFDTYIEDYSTRQKKRMPLVHTLDIRLDKAFIWDHLVWTIYLDVQNIYNNRPKEGVIYNYDYSQYTYAEGLPILPAIGMQLEY